MDMCACVLVGVALPKVRGVIRTGGRRCAYGTMALWHCGTLALWHCGTVVLWHYGTMALPSRVSHGNPTNQIVINQACNGHIFT